MATDAECCSLHNLSSAEGSSDIHAATRCDFARLGWRPDLEKKAPDICKSLPTARNYSCGFAVLALADQQWLSLLTPIQFHVQLDSTCESHSNVVKAAHISSGDYVPGDLCLHSC